LLPPALSVVPLLIVSLAAVPAHAGLGGSVASVHADGARIGSAVAAVSAGHFTRYALSRPNGGSVRELANPAGQVFAVSWSGPGKPDLRALLGDYFPALQAAHASPGRALHGFRRPPPTGGGDLQIQESGHMGWFRGIAYIPSLAPPGFSADDLAQEP
jgi:hypothetical protein